MRQAVTDVAQLRRPLHRLLLLWCLWRHEGDLEDLVALNEAYHRAIHRISGCTYLERRLDGQRMYDHAQRIALHSEPDERRRGFEEHRDIYEALLARDPARAELRMRRHIVRSAKAHVRLVFGADAEGLDYDE